MKKEIFLFLAVACFAFVIGYEYGKATPCTDEESFEIHPLPGP